MKRFFVAAAAVGLLAGVGAQTWAQYSPCTGSYAGYCRWGTPTSECYSINKGADDSKDCAAEFDNCKVNGYLYTDATCTTWNPVGNKNPNVTVDPGTGCCKWKETNQPLGCRDVNTKEEETDCQKGSNTYWTQSCGVALADDSKTCPSESPLYDGGAVPVLGCCKWANDDVPGASCRNVTTADEKTSCQTGANVYWDSPAQCGAQLSDNSLTCPSSTPTYNGQEAACSGKWCYWDANAETGGAAGCFQVVSSATESCADAIANCESYSPRKQTYDSQAACVAATGVKLVGSKAATPGLKVSYAKNRVTVNWTPSAKLSSGTVQLVNAKGAVLSTAFIKANSSKVTAKLGTVGVPAGMYFVHINAVGQNGQKIVTQSAVSIVK